MTDIDIFNGDADGICALTQLRLAEPRDGARIVTGVKRDIALVGKADVASGDRVTVLDLSFDKNRQAVTDGLAAGASFFYCDHHHAGAIPESAALETLIETAADVCTSLLIHRRTGGAFAGWAVVGAFGDNLDASASHLATQSGLSEAQCDLAARLGRAMNYNGYGATVADLHIAPAELYRRTSTFESPFDFVAQDAETFATIENGYREDMATATALNASHASEHAAVYMLPAAKWARRVSGVFGNDLAKQHPDRAHAVLTDLGEGAAFVVSVRAPLTRKTGADELCRSFPTGGGRAAAAGINELPADQVEAFVRQFDAFFAP